MASDEFDEIAELFLPLTRGAPEALGLLDDAAVIPSRPGFDLVVTKDAIVAGVHALPNESPGDLARKLLGVNLSDLAAKGAEPYGAFLAVSWPDHWTAGMRRGFAQVLGEHAARYNVKLFGGDTVRTSGPFQASLTMLGWTPQGEMIRRNGARIGDSVLVSGTIGDGWLGLIAAKGEGAFPAQDRTWLADRYRVPQPRCGIEPLCRQICTSAADVSDGLLADVGHIAKASKVCLRIDLEAIPLSLSATRWLSLEPNPRDARVALATGGDDYEIVCTVPSRLSARLMDEARQFGVSFHVIGEVTAGEGVLPCWKGAPTVVERQGWSHIQ